MSLQRRRERYDIIMGMWKILHGISSNDLQIQFAENTRLGVQAKVPSFNKNISVAHQTLYELMNITVIDNFKHNLSYRCA